GRCRVMLPFTVENFASSRQSVRPIVRFNDPLTVLPDAVPVVDSRTDPFTVRPSASPFSDSPSTLPLTVLPTKVTPTGTCTSKRTVVSLFFVRDRLSPPASQRFGTAASALG